MTHDARMTNTRAQFTPNEVSNAVKELAIGKARRFLPLEPMRLGGFAEPVQLYELLPVATRNRHSSVVCI